MKTMVKFVVLFASFLLLTGMAFARSYNCDCYEITATEVDNPEHTHTAVVPICLDNENMSGYVDSPLGTISLSLFFDNWDLKILAYASGKQTYLGDCVGFFKFHGPFDYKIIAGPAYCDGVRWKLHGHRIEYCSGLVDS